MLADDDDDELEDTASEEEIEAELDPKGLLAYLLISLLEVRFFT